MEKEEITLSIKGDIVKSEDIAQPAEVPAVSAEKADEKQKGDTMEIDSLKDADFSEDAYNDFDDDTTGEQLPPTEEELAAQRLEKKKTKAKKRRKALKRHERTFAHIFGGILLTVFIVSVSVILAVYIIGAALDFTGITTNDYSVQVEIQPNSDIDEVADILVENGVISNKELFRFYANLTDKNTGFLNGMFTLKTSMSYSSIISTLMTSNTSQEIISLQIPEGMTGEEIGQLLEDNCVCKAEDFREFFKDRMNVYSFEKRLEYSSLKFNQMEGFLFPDTYDFYVLDELKRYRESLLDENKPVVDISNLDTSVEAKAAAQKLFSNFNSKITKEMYKKMNELGLTLNDTIALASIIQEEASLTSDMKKVASVFFNRMKNSETFPNLESDVTVIYVNDYIKPFTDGLSASLYQKIYDAYNTYECVGIPSGPICNPGLTAIEAVLYPADTNYYYFCANTETGEVYFAATHAEHEENLIKAGLTE